MNRKEYLQNSNSAIIILHEIYGLNKFIEEVCKWYFDKGYDIFCPYLLSTTTCFNYSQSEEAYHYFTSFIGFDIYNEVDKLIVPLKDKYDKVFVLGFSIGATIAWRCSANEKCDGIVGYYGSRIRDYLDVKPVCPCNLIFAREDNFDITKVSDVLKHKRNVTVEILDGKHGFMDYYSDRYHPISLEKARKITDDFLLMNSR